MRSLRLNRNAAVDEGSAPASGAVNPATRLTVSLENDFPFSASARLFVRPEAGRTAAEAAALPENSTASFRLKACTHEKFA